MFFCLHAFCSFLRLFLGYSLNSALSSKCLVSKLSSGEISPELVEKLRLLSREPWWWKLFVLLRLLLQVGNIFLSFSCSRVVDWRWDGFLAAWSFQCYHFNRKFSNELGEVNPSTKKAENILFYSVGYIHVLNAVHAKRENTDTNERNRQKKKTRVDGGTLRVVMMWQIKGFRRVEGGEPSGTAQHRVVGPNSGSYAHAYKLLLLRFSQKRKRFPCVLFSIGRRSCEGRMEKMPVKLFSLTISILSKGSPFIHKLRLGGERKVALKSKSPSPKSRSSRPRCKTNENN